ncbi:hypothetical protein TRFO_01251 [Tritrichomonas foetus]|uniref:BEACH domain-containing protein n=1 Tax=Tritrichomonas foetus TaxID=1144522 RepID=A0A1J4K6Q0_9EUKA|nr:hypothetical protein TRFO_01251 [Tritrichomonas foetus]|eukprot:OHT07145.1 hypothetical protein TRFO_01251 [Tritrichomonas foetus]
MFSLNSSLSSAQIERKIKVIQKYYTLQIQIPHALSKKIPLTKSFSKFLTFKPVNKKLFVPIFKLSKNTEIEEAIATICVFDKSINPEYFEFYQKAAFLTKTKEMEQCLEYIFHCSMRFFINLIYLIPSEISNSIKNPQASSLIISNIAKLFCYFTRNEEYLNNDFFEIYSLLIGEYSLSWKDVFSSKSLSLKSNFISFSMCLIPLIPFEAKNQNLEQKVTFPFIIEQLNLTIDYLPSIFQTPQFFTQFQSILSGFIAFISFSNEEQCLKVMKSIVQILDYMRKSNFNKKDGTQIGFICLNIYCDCCKIVKIKLPMNQFQSLYYFIIWAIKGFSDKIDMGNDEDYQFNFNSELGEIGLGSYIKRNHTLQSIGLITISNTITHYVDKFSKIISLSKNQNKLIAKVISILLNIKNLPEFKAIVVFTFDVLNKVDDAPISAVMTKNWSKLFFKEIFTQTSTNQQLSEQNNQPNSGHNIRLQNMIMMVIFKCFVGRADFRVEILDSVSEFITKTKNYSQMLPFLNSLLAANDSIEYGNALSNSHLIKNIIEGSNQYNLILDYLRTTIYVYPKDLFSSTNICTFIESKIIIPEYQPHLIDCIERGLRHCGSSMHTTTSLNQLLGLITCIIHELIEKNDQFLINIMESVSRSIPSFHPLNSDSLIKTGVFEVIVSAIPTIKTQNYFKHAIELFTTAWRSTWEMQEKFINNHFFVNIVLLKAINENILDFDLTEELMDFATNTNGVYSNSFALYMLLKWCAGKPGEKHILEIINEKAKESMSNALCLQRAKIVDHIFSRLDKVSFVPLLLELLSTFCLYGFSNSVFYSAIKLMKSSSFIYPHLVIAVFLHLLKMKNNSEISSFFYFDGNNSGIFGPTITNSVNSLTIVTRIRPIDIDSSAELPLFALRSEAKNLLLFGFQKNKLICRMNKTINQFNYEFQNSNWYNIVIVINKKVQLYVNNVQDQSVIQIEPFFSGATGIWIGCSTKKPHSCCYRGCIGTILFLNEFNPELDYFSVNVLNLPKQIREHLVSYYHPRNVLNSKITKVTKYDDDVCMLQGFAIQSFITIESVLPSINSIDNILPLLLRLKGCIKCKESTEYCHECGCLSLQDGQQYLDNILSLIANILAHTRSLVSNLAVGTFSTLLSTMLCQVKTIFYTESLLGNLLKIFENLKFVEMGAKFVIMIWLNFDLINKFNHELQAKYFSLYAYSAFDISKDAFLAFGTFDFIIYRLIKFYHDGTDLSYLAWKFGFHLMKQKMDNNTASSLVAIPLNIENENVAFLILSFIQDLVLENNTSMIQVLQKCNCLLPFVILLTKNSPTIQIQAITSMNHFYHQTDVFISAIHQSIVILNTKQDLRQLINSMMGYFESGKLLYLPLIMYAIDSLTENDFLIYWNKIATILVNPDTPRSEDEIWPYWLIRFIHIRENRLTGKNNNQINDQIANQVNYEELRMIYASIFSMYALHEFENGNKNVLNDLQIFFIADLIETGFAFDDIFKEVCIHILNVFLCNQKLRENCMKQLAATCFVTLFYQPSQVTAKKETELPEFLNHLPFLKNKFCWYHSDATIQHNFDLKKTQDDQWYDLNFAERIMPFIRHLKNFEFDITQDFSINSFVGFSYILINLVRSNYDLFEETVKHIVSLFDSIEDYETIWLIIAVLSRESKFDFYPIFHELHQKYSNQSNTELDGTEKSNEKPEIIYDKPTNKEGIDVELKRLFIQFETNLLAQAPIISAEQCLKRRQICNKIDSNLQARLQISSKMKTSKRNKTPKTEIDQFLFSMNTNSLSALNIVYCNFKKRQKDAIIGSISCSIKILNGFIKELQMGSGPWSEPYQNLHFKSAKRTSPTGGRAMMRINYTFNDHKTAQNIKQRLKIPIIRSSSKNQVGFRTNVNLTTLRFVYEGELSVSSGSVVFECPKKKIEIPFRRIAFIFTRTQGREDTAAEIYMNTNKSYIFVFAAEDERSEFLQVIEQQHFQIESQLSGKKFNFFKELRDVSSGICQKVKASELLQKLKLTEKWQNREISTFSYLFYINILAGRSFNDISQYPVYPWVISDYESDTIDLKDPKVYRDLSRPLGALNEKQIVTLREAYQEDCGSPLGSCLYRSHYSSPHLVCGFLIRMEPFTTIHVSIQGDQFDDSTRIFSSVGKIWSDIITGTRDFRELVPEFYSNYHFLLNENGFDLKADHDNVELPKWANDSPARFVKINRAALESEYVSMNIHHWIDLIFGINRNSFEHDNIYMPFSYIENIPENPEFAPMMQESALNFGICAQKIFDAPHPQRYPAEKLLIRPMPSIIPDSPPLRIRKKTIVSTTMNVIWPNEQKSKFVSNLTPTLIEVSRIFNMVFFAGEMDSSVSCFTIEGEIKTLNISPSIINVISVVAGRTLLTGSSDGALRRWALPTMKYLSISSFHCYPVISCAGNGDLNLVVSLDSHCNMIYETMNDAIFIRNVIIELFGKNPFIVVFKSGSVVVILKNQEKSKIMIFDIQGTQVTSKEFDQPILEYDKFTTEYGSEILIVALGEEKLLCLSVPELDVLKEIPGRFQKGKFCMLKKSKIILASTEPNRIIPINYY